MSDNNLVDELAEDGDDQRRGVLGDVTGRGLQNAYSTSTIGRSGFNFNSNGEVQHTQSVLDQIGRLLMNENCSDVTFLVEGQRFPAHRVVLGARSAYFWALLYGGMRESTQSEITLVDTSQQAFKILLKYIYTGRCQLNQMGLDLLIDVLGLSNKYGFTELESAIADYLKSIISVRNACAIYSTATLYSMSPLVVTCLDYIDSYAEEILSTQAFLQFPGSAIIQIIERNSFCAPEISIFNTLLRWYSLHPGEEEAFHAMLGKVRLSLIKLDDLLNVVRPTSLISSDQLLDAINDQSKKRSCELVYRGFLFPNVNVATVAQGAKVIAGQFPTALLNTSDYQARDIERTFTRHAISANDPGIVVELGRCFIINNIKLLLLDRDQLCYSYYVEVSVDQKDWLRVIDHTQYHCRSRQNLFFQERVVKFIRVVGTQPSYYSTFNLVTFEAMYNTESFDVDSATTLLIPHHNVATIPNNAIVIQGISRSRNALLNGDVTNYDWDTGYTCHELGACRDNSKCIIVQLPQPYLLGSMRLLLWDRDERHYSFYIEVSVDAQLWTKVIEVAQRRSWQTLRFPRTPVVYVKIVGTANTANEVFHCVHLECPAVSDVGGAGVSEDVPSTSAEAGRPEEGADESQQAGAGDNEPTEPSSPSREALPAIEEGSDEISE